MRKQRDRLSSRSRSRTRQRRVRRTRSRSERQHRGRSGRSQSERSQPNRCLRTPSRSERRRGKRTPSERSRREQLRLEQRREERTLTEQRRCELSQSRRSRRERSHSHRSQRKRSLSERRGSENKRDRASRSTTRRRSHANRKRYSSRSRSRASRMTNKYKSIDRSVTRSRSRVRCSRSTERSILKSRSTRRTASRRFNYSRSVLYSRGRSYSRCARNSNQGHHKRSECNMQNNRSSPMPQIEYTSRVPSPVPENNAHLGKIDTSLNESKEVAATGTGSMAAVSANEMEQCSSLTNNQLLETLNKTLQTMTTVASMSHSKGKFTNLNVVPEFDPNVKHQTIINWLNKVKECAEIYGWNSQQTAHYALPKLTGTAKRWYEGQPTVLHSWEIWEEKLKLAFPCNENYGHLINEMMNITAKFGDNLEEYFYEKLNALNRCLIANRNAVDCIVYGIEDRSVRYGCEAASFDTTDKLLGYLKTVKHERNNKFNKRNSFKTSIDLTRKNQRFLLKCYNCNETGHTIPQCKKPKIKCQKCLRYGHDDPSCTLDILKKSKVLDVKTL
ncbi:serine/arginine-rich splicing factor 4-like [Cydia amplana]|uniref:serine/arginine-rich splicing factor 4-like n=1 Tax=Cydia amplana TaxID=1869771 RepID=UPI002FE5DBBC